MNNRGWGLQAMLGMVLILMTVLIVTSIVVNSKLKHVFNDVTYSDLETRVEVALKEYEDIDYLKVNVETLQKENLLEPLIDKNNNTCEGYGIIEKKDGKIVRKAYIKCGEDYKTKGY